MDQCGAGVAAQGVVRMGVVVMGMGLGRSRGGYADDCDGLELHRFSWGNLEER